jgi:hypothetical protein
MEAEFFHADGQDRDRRDEAKSRFSQFSERRIEGWKWIFYCI